MVQVTDEVQCTLITFEVVKEMIVIMRMSLFMIRVIAEISDSIAEASWARGFGR